MPVDLFSSIRDYFGSAEEYLTGIVGDSTSGGGLLGGGDSGSIWNMLGKGVVSSFSEQSEKEDTVKQGLESRLTGSILSGAIREAKLQPSSYGRSNRSKSVQFSEAVSPETLNAYWRTRMATFAGIQRQTGSKIKEIDSVE